jgi:hypothetical protein
VAWIFYTISRSQIFVAFVLPSIRGIKFHTHIKQRAKLQYHII